MSKKAHKKIHKKEAKKQQREAIWDRQASRKLIFICFIIILATAICFGGTFLQYKKPMKAPDQIWTDSSTSYEEKLEQQRAAEEEIQKSRKDALTE